MCVHPKEPQYPCQRVPFGKRYLLDEASLHRRICNIILQNNLVANIEHVTTDAYAIRWWKTYIPSFSFFTFEYGIIFTRENNLD